VLEKELGVKAEIEVGARGSFIVKVDGEVVAQKENDFPSEEAIVAAVRARLSNS
jgi:predicted regulator of Ras-like GTPase activity (Roadblock/LC7/MglB family)